MSRKPITQQAIEEGFKALDRLHQASDEVIYSALAQAAVCYLDLLKGEVVNGHKLVSVKREDR